MSCPPVHEDNPQALASGLSYVQVGKYGRTVILFCLFNSRIQLLPNQKGLYFPNFGDFFPKLRILLGFIPKFKMHRLHKKSNKITVSLFYTTHISVELAHHEIFCAKVGKGGHNICYGTGVNFTFFMSSSVTQESFEISSLKFQPCFFNIKPRYRRECSGSVVECLIQDEGALGLSLTGVTVLCP